MGQMKFSYMPGKGQKIHTYEYIFFDGSIEILVLTSQYIEVL